MLNKKIADSFNTIAELLEMKGDTWRARAYQKAARQIEAMKESELRRYYDKDKLTEIEGIGESLEKKIKEIIETGSLEYLEKLRDELPGRLADVTKVPSIGPKRANKLYSELGITDLKSLRKKAEAGEIRKIKGFGKKSEQKILQGIDLVEESSERYLLHEIEPVAERLKTYLSSYVNKSAIAGSLRRVKETVGDIDILATGNSKQIMDAFTKFKELEKVVEKGETKARIRLEKGIQADLRVVDDKSYGAALLYFTGSKDHNVALRSIANEKGWKLNEYGLFNERNQKQIAGNTETEIYNAFGFAWIPPELREDRGEIQAAREGTLPNLINQEDIKGDLQAHSTWSDGHHSIAEMAKEAGKMAYEYLGITDHSKGVGVVDGMDEQAAKKRKKEIKEVNENTEVEILNGVEVDVNKDGTLNMQESLLKQFDIVIGAIHGNFQLSVEKQTSRIRNAFKTGLIDIFAHPTGIMRGVRKPYQIDFPKIIEAAKEHQVVLEINAFPNRLDLDSEQARTAMKNGVKLSINTDAHGKAHFAYMKYGVGVARRAWLEPEDVLNTCSYVELQEFLRK